MPVVSTRTIIADAVRAGTGAAAFNVVTLETAEALVRAAETAGRPLILQISENCIGFHGALAPLAAATRALAEASDADFALHLDHAEDPELARAAVDHGFGSVMFDGAKLDFDENVRVTAEVAAYAHERGVYVEAELGEVGGKNGAHAPGVRTDPAEAQAFVAATGVDALAVAVGSTHARTDRTTRLDLDLITRLRDGLDVPLVLHGSSGVADDHMREAIGAGITKVNVSTHLNGFFTRAVRATLDEDPAMVDMRKYLGPGREAMAVEAARLITLITGH